jgi:alkylhydroperoxidase family enzyme
MIERAALKRSVVGPARLTKIASAAARTRWSDHVRIAECGGMGLTHAPAWPRSFRPLNRICIGKVRSRGVRSDRAAADLRRAATRDEAGRALIVPDGCGNMSRRQGRGPLSTAFMHVIQRLESMSQKPRISYVDPKTVNDPAMLAEFERCAREGTPRPESQAVRAHVPAVFWSFANSWRDVFHNGVADHSIKELCRLYVSRAVKCEFCGNQRSIKSAKAGMSEDATLDLINFEGSARYTERQKAALSYAEAITWDLPVDDAFWARLHRNFSEPELVEIGYFVALTMGQQRWLRTLDIEHHQVMVGQSGSMAPGFETEDALRRSKGSPEYWARKDKAATQAAE